LLVLFPKRNRSFGPVQIWHRPEGHWDVP
jgi:hypothetical protein